jgi:hypothetical protein
MRRQISTLATAIMLAGLFAGPSSSDQLQVPQRPQVAAQDNPAAPSMTILGSSQAEGILGKEVRSRADENMGRIIDVVVDRTGRARAAVIDFGGFLGVGSRKIAVEWNALSFAEEGGKRDVVMLDLTREQVKAAPEYKDKRAVIVVGAADSPHE